MVTVEDGTVVGGLGSAVADIFAEKDHEVMLRRIGIPDQFVAQGSVAELRRLCGLDSESIADVIMECAASPLAHDCLKTAESQTSVK